MPVFLVQKGPCPVINPSQVDKGANFWARHLGDKQRAIPMPAELAVDDAVPSDEFLQGRSGVFDACNTAS